MGVLRGDGEAADQGDYSVSESAGEVIDASDIVYATLVEHAWRMNALTAQERNDHFAKVLQLEQLFKGWETQEPTRCGVCGCTAMEIKGRVGRDTRWRCLEPTCKREWGYAS